MWQNNLLIGIMYVNREVEFLFIDLSKSNIGSNNCIKHEAWIDLRWKVEKLPRILWMTVFRIDPVSGLSRFTVLTKLYITMFRLRWYAGIQSSPVLLAYWHPNSICFIKIVKKSSSFLVWLNSWTLLDAKGCKCLRVNKWISSSFYCFLTVPFSTLKI